MAEITQASEWYPESYEDVPGLAALRDDDPGNHGDNNEDPADTPAPTPSARQFGLISGENRHLVPSLAVLG